MLNSRDIPRIVADRKRFNNTLYTPLPKVYEELERRRRNPRLMNAVLEYLSGRMLEPLREQPRAVIARSIVSPNYEVRRFTDLVETHGKLEPLYLEYHADIYTPKNASKHMLGRLFFFDGHGKNGGMKLHSLNILDFSCANGEPCSSVRTLGGQALIDFHHEIFDARYRKLSHKFYDTSRWLRAHGKNAKSYYRAFLSLFICNGILFENVLLNEQEFGFTSLVFLPAFMSVYRRFGLKPLIAPLTPIETEDSRLWMCYPGTDKHFVAEKMQCVV